MDKQHPHLGATYKIVARFDGSFGVEIKVPEAELVRVTGFPTEKLAAAWVVSHEAEVATGALPKSKLRAWKRGG